jgi:hypothetical protein
VVKILNDELWFSPLNLKPSNSTPTTKVFVASDDRFSPMALHCQCYQRRTHIVKVIANGDSVINCKSDAKCEN